MSEQQTRAVATLRGQIEQMGPQFKTVLPQHISVDRFGRIVMTAVQRDPALLEADRRSLMMSCVQCAQDGLLPDGREAALVVYNTKSGNGWIKKVQYIPMIAGLRKKVRQSGEIVSWESRLVHENDHFEVFYGDDERIEHTPNLFSPGKIIAAYSIATFRDGYKSREVMTIDQLEAIRQKSKSKDSGPWSDPAFRPEMYRKTVMRRHAKALPLSPELQDLMSRDDSLITLPRSQYQGEVREAPAQGVSKQSAIAYTNGNGKPTSLDEFATEPAAGDPAPAVAGPQSDAEPPSGADAVEAVPERDEGASSGAAASDDYDAGYQAGLDGKSKRACPADVREDEARAEEWKRGHSEGTAERARVNEGAEA